MPSSLADAGKLFASGHIRRSTGTWPRRAALARCCRSTSPPWPISICRGVLDAAKRTSRTAGNPLYPTTPIREDTKQSSRQFARQLAKLPPDRLQLGALFHPQGAVAVRAARVRIQRRELSRVVEHPPAVVI